MISYLHTPGTLWASRNLLSGPGLPGGCWCSEDRGVQPASGRLGVNWPAAPGCAAQASPWRRTEWEEGPAWCPWAHWEAESPVRITSSNPSHRPASPAGHHLCLWLSCLTDRPLTLPAPGHRCCRPCTALPPVTAPGMRAPVPPVPREEQGSSHRRPPHCGFSGRPRASSALDAEGWGCRFLRRSGTSAGRWASHDATTYRGPDWPGDGHTPGFQEGDHLFCPMEAGAQNKPRTFQALRE